MLFSVQGSVCVFFFQAEDGIRDAQESRGLGDVYKRQHINSELEAEVIRRWGWPNGPWNRMDSRGVLFNARWYSFCLLYTSDAADEEDSVDLGGRRSIKKKK
eukprot:TRINITY_DN44119_c0_g1_i1.p1 TRINITY_DN44119_c0_g1~~TRINITY_DN44119_c0_g1_i1.p1  ORF type:complete len:102 (-),score=25.37 TRINITY_DN44119_c0_g1_i1:45-350(-)